jgi:hypothetical protein
MFVERYAAGQEFDFGIVSRARRSVFEYTGRGSLEPGVVDVVVGSRRGLVILNFSGFLVRGLVSSSFYTSPSKTQTFLILKL